LRSTKTRRKTREIKRPVLAIKANSGGKGVPKAKKNRGFLSKKTHGRGVSQNVQKKRRGRRRRATGR